MVNVGVDVEVGVLDDVGEGVKVNVGVFEGVTVKVEVDVNVGVLVGVRVKVEVKEAVGVNVTTAHSGAESVNPAGLLVRKYSSYSFTYCTCGTCFNEALKAGNRL
ncbi:MAG: hypothetical protein JNJ43_10320 [Anaerolineales bacterium]|nr:hypothetical protein [Anaerolineales bacterium]